MHTDEIQSRARTVASAGGLCAALASGQLATTVSVSVSEGVVLGLLRQEVRTFFGILGHGSTDLGEVLRIYAEARVIQFIQCRNEVAMAHAATALGWIYGEMAAVVTSIGPGALQAFAGSLAAASNGIGVYHLYGDETTHGEGPNMQQIPGPRQNQFGRLTEIMGASYTLHTPEALREAMRRGVQTVNHPSFAGPFYLCLPINVQPQVIEHLRLDTLPERLKAPVMIPAPEHFRAANVLAGRHSRIVIKAGGGAVAAPDAVRRLAERLGAVVVLSPKALGVLPDAHPLNMHVGGSKGSISGNFAMSEADLLIVIGSRAVCQADCSGTGYQKVESVININGVLSDAAHYSRTLILTGDILAVIEAWLDALGPLTAADDARASDWLHGCATQKKDWQAFKFKRLETETLFDSVWGRSVLTQPSAIAALARFANETNAVKIFDAGDVQANGFQIVEDNHPRETITETGASYMGFAASALLSSAAASNPRYLVAFSGDGSFMMNPQILIDAVAHGVRGMVVIFDNRRMAAISSLQNAQYGPDFGTNDDVEIDYVALARAVRGVRAVFGGWTMPEFEAALLDAYSHKGLSVVHVPVYWGNNPLGGMGAYGRWNVGPWCAEVERLYASQII